MNLESKKLIRRTVGILILFLIMMSSNCIYNKLHVDCYRDKDGDKIGNTKEWKECFLNCPDGYVETYADPDDSNKKCREKDDLACKKASYCAELIKIEATECLPKFKLFIENRGDRDLVNIQLSPNITIKDNESVIPILPKAIPILLSKENSEAIYSEVFTLNKLVELSNGEYEFSVNINMPEIVSDTTLKVVFTLPNCGKINLNDAITSRSRLKIECTHRTLHQLGYKKQKAVIYKNCKFNCTKDSVIVSLIGENEILKIHPTIPIVKDTTATVVEAKKEVTTKKPIKKKQIVKDKQNEIFNDEEPPEFIQKDCFNLGLNIGDSCDDKNPKTEDDKVWQDCVCTGYIKYDCETLNKNIGDICNNKGIVTKDCLCEVKTKLLENNDKKICAELNQMKMELKKLGNEIRVKIKNCDGKIFSRQNELCEGELRKMKDSYKIKHANYQNLIFKFNSNT